MVYSYVGGEIMLWSVIELSLFVLLATAILYWIARLLIWTFGFVREVIFPEIVNESKNEDTFGSLEGSSEEVSSASYDQTSQSFSQE